MQLSTNIDQRDAHRGPSQRGRRVLSETGKYVLLLALVVLFVTPFLWIITTALKTTPELAAFPVHFLPDKPAWDNFVQAFTSINFLAYAANSFILSTIYSTLVTLSSALVGFGFARLKA